MSRDFHPTGQVTFEGSVLVDANNFAGDVDNQTTLKATLADNRGIPVSGMRSFNGSFDLYVTNEGPEIETVNITLAGTQHTCGFKFPVNGINLQALVTFAKCSIKQNLGDALILTCTVMGHIVDAQGI
jgi:hypothetical protein